MSSVDGEVIVDVIVVATVAVAVHVHGNATLIVIATDFGSDMRRCKPHKDR